VAELVAAIEAVEGRLLICVGVEGKGRLVGGEVRRFARIERARVGLGFGLARVGEKRCQAGSDVAAARNRAEIVDVPENAKLRERLEDAKVERGRANTAARQRETDGPETREIGGLLVQARELAALRDVCALSCNHRGKGFDDLPRIAGSPGKPEQGPGECDRDDDGEEQPLDCGRCAAESRRGGRRLVRMREHLEEAEVLGAIEDSCNDRAAQEHRREGVLLVPQEPHEHESEAAQARAIAEDEEPIGSYAFPGRLDLALQRVGVGRARLREAPGGENRRRAVLREGQLQAQQVLGGNQRVDDATQALDPWLAVVGQLPIQVAQVLPGPHRPDEGKNDHENKRRHPPRLPLAARG
jgi:hypothetical protein